MISACWSAMAPTGSIASHIPFLSSATATQLHLHGHLARPNPQVGDLARGGEVLAIFHGPHAYISPNWYATGPSVPTWNYADVHAYGTVRLVEDAGLAAPVAAPSVGAARGRATRRRGGCRISPSPTSNGMLKGIVGLEIAVTRLEGKFKLSQNRPAADRPGVIAALEARSTDDTRAVARLMHDREAV